jgi:5-methyltetrahydropteroyltriglutamate--homocysteine methyltransferase
MTDASGPPFRADHVGSLPRPQRLLDARARYAAGEIDAAELRGIEDEAITDVVRLQGDVGLRSSWRCLRSAGSPRPWRATR